MSSVIPKRNILFYFFHCFQLGCYVRFCNGTKCRFSGLRHALRYMELAALNPHIAGLKKLLSCMGEKGLWDWCVRRGTMSAEKGKGREGKGCNNINKIGHFSPIITRSAQNVVQTAKKSATGHTVQFLCGRFKQFIPRTVIVQCKI